jgi:hypothetical protein
MALQCDIIPSSNPAWACRSGAVLVPAQHARGAMGARITSHDADGPECWIHVRLSHISAAAQTDPFPGD